MYFKKIKLLIRYCIFILQNVVFEDCVRKSISQSLNSKLIDSEGFWIEVEEICQLLKPFTKILREFESDQSNLSLVYHRFVILFKNYYLLYK